jgi:hypothetical protein
LVLLVTVRPFLRRRSDAAGLLVVFALAVAEANPAAYLPDLAASSLNNLSNGLADAGRPQEAEVIRARS